MKRIMGFTFLTLFVFSLIQVFGPSLPAQSRIWNQGKQPREGVCFYVDTDYKGEEFCVDGNDAQRNLEPRYNDKVSSVRIFGGANLTVYEDSNYQGSSQTYSQDAPNLRNWGDRISSFQIKGDRRNTQRSDRQPGTGSWVRGNDSREGVCFYVDADYKGEEFCVDGNDTQRNLEPRYNDRVSSVRIFGGTNVTVYENSNYQGSSQTYSQDVPNLLNWGDRISSFQIRGDRRNSARNDSWGRGNESPEGVCFYSETNYRGDEICVIGNENLRQLDTRFKNKISSIRVSRGAQVTVFANQNFNGRSQVLSQDNPNLQNWSNRIASFQVKLDPQYGGRNRNQAVRQYDGWVRESREGVCFYSDADYQGDEICVDGNESQRQLDRRFRNKISSVRVSGGSQVTVFGNPNFNGRSQTYSQNVPNLQDWSNRISSFQVKLDPRYGGRNRSQTGGQRDGLVRNNDSGRRVCFYRDSNYRGEEFCVAGTGKQQKIDNRFDDEISSIRVYNGAQVTVYEHVNFGGIRRVITQDTPGLGNLNDKITSIEVK